MVGWGGVEGWCGVGLAGEEAFQPEGAWPRGCGGGQGTRGAPRSPCVGHRGAEPGSSVAMGAADDTSGIPVVLLGRHVPHAWEGTPRDKLYPEEGTLGMRKGMQRPRVRASPDRKSTRLNSSHRIASRMPSSA